MTKDIDHKGTRNLLAYLDRLDAQSSWNIRSYTSDSRMCRVVLTSGDHLLILFTEDGRLSYELTRERSNEMQERDLDFDKIEFIQFDWDTAFERTISMPLRSLPNPSNPPSGLFYRNSNIEMKLGDRIRIKRFFRRSLEGRVTFIARGDPDPITDPYDIHRWGYEYVHPDTNVTHYQPVKSPPTRKVVFVSRYDS